MTRYKNSKGRYRKSKNRKKPIIILAVMFSVMVTVFLTGGTFSKYVNEWYSEYVQADALKFYFGSNYLVSGQGNYPTYEYVIDDTSNATVYFEIYNYTDDLKVSEVDINDIEFSIGAYTLRYGEDVAKGEITYDDGTGTYEETEPVWIQDETDERLYKALVQIIVPEERFDDGWTPTVKVTATATAPYTAEIAALFELHTSVNSDEIEFTVKDTEDNNALILTIETNDTEGVATINWDIDGATDLDALYADPTSSLLYSVDNANKTLTTVVLDKYSSYEIIFFKADSTQNYQDTVNFSLGGSTE